MLLNLWACRNAGTGVPSSPPWAERPEPFLHGRNKRFPDKNISALCCQVSWCTQHTATKCSECCSSLELLFFMGRLLSWKMPRLAGPQEVKQCITVGPSYSLSLLPPQICLGFVFFHPSGQSSPYPGETQNAAVACASEGFISTSPLHCLLIDGANNPKLPMGANFLLLHCPRRSVTLNEKPHNMICVCIKWFISKAHCISSASTHVLFPWQRQIAISAAGPAKAICTCFAKWQETPLCTLVPPELSC